MFVKAESINKLNKLNNYIGPATIYQAVVGVLGLYLIYRSSTQWSFDLLWLYFFWSLFSTVTELKPIVKESNIQLTVSFAVHIAALILFGAPTAILISTIANIIVDAVGRRGLKKMIFNVSQYSITIYLSWIVYNFFASNAPGLNLKENFSAMILSCMTYVFANYLLVSTIIALSQGKKLVLLLTKDAKLELLHFAALAPVSLLIVILYIVEPLSVLIVFLPLAVAHFSFDNYINLRKQTKTTVEVLAEIIDKRDSYTSKHSYRVSEYCNLISEELQLSPDDTEVIVTAARVHDLGKIAIPDSILLKQGRLEPGERDKMLSHSREGYNILNNLKPYKSGAKLVLYHHERFDGTGYPGGLKGDNIPLGARILAVADSYDAMTTDRPYRKAMSEKVAMDELKRCSGTQFDPKVVEAFLRVKQREWEKDRN